MTTRPSDPTDGELAEMGYTWRWWVDELHERWPVPREPYASQTGATFKAALKAREEAARREVVAAVEALHPRRDSGNRHTQYPNGYCGECHDDYPCPAVRAARSAARETP